MHSLSLLPLLLAASSVAKSPPASPTWEKIFDGGNTDGWVYAVKAFGRDQWVAGGQWGVAAANKAGVKVETTHGRAVLGLFVEASDSVFALGRDELIWRFDGTTWSEEHTGPTPRRAGRGADLLYSAYYRDASSNGPLVAIGPSLVLVRQADRRWADPPKTDRGRLLELGQMGPKISRRPARCEALAWRWLAKDQGLFFCDDRRVFIYDGGAVTPKGKMPRQCEAAITSVAYVHGDIYTSCDSATLWRTDNQTWQPIAAPKGLKEIPSISVADGCVFVAGLQAIWRSCKP